MGMWVKEEEFDGVGEEVVRGAQAEGCRGIAGSIAYNWPLPVMKTIVKIIHARLHAQALTLAALVGAAVVEYHDHQTGTKADRYAKFLNLDDHHLKE